MYKKRNREYWKNYKRNRRALAKAKSLIKANGDSFVGEDEPISKVDQYINRLEIAERKLEALMKAVYI